MYMKLSDVPNYDNFDFFKAAMHQFELFFILLLEVLLIAIFPEKKTINFKLVFLVFFFNLIGTLSNIIFTALHVISQNSFPKPLSAKNEKKYLDLLKEKDANAKNMLIKHNLRLVAHITKKYYSGNFCNKSEPDDLISIGTIGLIKAVNTFNPDRGIKLSSYAARCIENEILMHFRNLKKTSLDVSMNEPIETDKNGNILTLMDTLSTNDSIVNEIATKINIQKLDKFLVQHLNPRERIIICLRYGLGGCIPLPQREVAAKLGISRSYVSRIEKKALCVLKSNF